MRYLGIDYGTRYIGLALSDDDGKMGFPHRVIENSSTVLDTLETLVKEENVEHIVIGESKDLDGTENKVFAACQRFADALRERTQLPIDFEPEFYTTKQARDATKLAGKGSERADSIAAAIILSSYLERDHD